MSAFLKRLTLFLVFLTIAWGCLWLVAMNIPIIEARFIAQEKDWGHVNKKTSDWIALREHEKMDVLLFGSSTCYEGIDLKHSLIWDTTLSTFAAQHKP